MPNFRRHLSSAFFFFFFFCLTKKFICKVERLNSNSVDDYHYHYEPSHLDLRCLQKPIIIVCGSERVNDSITNVFCNNFTGYTFEY